MAIYGRVEMFYEMSCNKIKMFLKIMKKMLALRYNKDNQFQKR